MRVVAASLVSVLLCAFAPPTAEGPEPAPTDEGLGGYWGLSERRPPEPKDGVTELWLGAFMLPVGLLRAGGGIGTAWVARPAGCQDLIDKYEVGEEDCASLYAYGWYGTAFGGLMAVTGAVLLGIGAHRARAHEEWQERAGYRAQLRPWIASSRTAWSIGVDLRF